MFYLIKNYQTQNEKNSKHKLGTYEIDKIFLSCFDDKRYVLDDGIRTLAYFHKDSVTSCKEIKKIAIKKIVIKNCDNLKKIVIVEKNHHD